jgi:hypothetical protein
MGHKFLYLVGIFMLFIVNLMSALPLYPNTGVANTTYQYTFNFTTNSDCSGVLLSNISSVTTNSSGWGFVDINISTLSDIPNYLCEYKNGVLRKVHLSSDQVFKNIYARNGNFSENINVNNIYANSLYEPVNNLLSVSLLSRALYTTTGGPSIFWQSGEIYAPIAGALSIQYDNRYLADTSEIASVRWSDRTLNEGDGDITLDWENNLLKSNSVTILDWSSYGNFGANALTCGAITSSSQATLNNLVVNGNSTLKRVTADNITAKNITADKYFGDGSLLTGIQTYNATYNGYNISYGKFWKNWTTETNLSMYLVYGSLWYNYSLVTPASIFNLTYDTWFSNYTLYNKYWYNMTVSGSTETDPIFSANFTNMQTDCSANNYVYGILSNGTFECRVDQTSSGGTYNATYDTWYPNFTAFNKFWYNMTVNLFNQVLNTFSNVTFNNITISTLNSASCDVKSTTSGNLYCGTDATGTSATRTETDSDFNRSQSFTFFEPFFINNAIETGEVGIMGWNYVGQGTGAGVSAKVTDVGNHPGQARLSTGTTLRGNGTLDLGLGMIVDSYAGNMTLEWLFNLSSNSTDANNYTIVMGFADNLGTTVFPVDGIFFVHNGTAINWTAVTSSNSARTFNDTNIVVNGNPWNEMRIELINQSDYQANFYINNVLVASQNTNIPRGTARAFGIMFAMRKLGGTTAITCDLDYVYYKQLFEYSR